MNLCPCCKQPVADNALLVSLDRNTASRNGIVVQLTPGEAEILHTLALRYPRVVSYDELMEARHGRQETPSYLSLKVMAHKIRKQLASLGMTLVAVHRTGYRLDIA